MLKLISIGFLVILSACASQSSISDAEIACVIHVAVNIKELHPPIRIKDDYERRSEIILRQYADCSTGLLKKPSSYAEALEWLDFALPVDFKRGITAGEYLNPYLYTPYGASVESDLFDHFSSAWQLDDKSPVCNEAIIKEVMKIEGFGCFTVLLDKLRESYKNPRPISESG